MNEPDARDVVLVRAIETADGAREVWTDADRAWAARTTAEIVGERARDEVFIARRARLVLERLAERYPRLRPVAQAPATRGWLAPVAAVVAFFIGAVGVDIGPSHRINLLAPPVLALLAWNIAVYVALVLTRLHADHRERDRTAPLRGSVVPWLRDVSRPLRRSLGPAPLAIALRRFTSDWTTLAMPLWHERAARFLHAGAAALAAGAIAGLYVRGIALEFRAGWQSTFLDATDVARILHVVLAPGAWLTGIAIPDAAHLATIGGETPGENAAPWIHLYAATLLLVIIVPRLALAALASIGERRLARRFPLALDSTYFQRLIRAWRQGTARVAVMPYSFDVPAARRDGLAKLAARVFDSGVELLWHPATPYGDDATATLAPPPLAGIVVLFNLTATPERENHGEFVDMLHAAAPRVPLIAVVDTSEFVERFAAQPRRVAERETAWREMLEPHRIDPLFVRLADPDLREDAITLGDRLERAA